MRILSIAFTLVAFVAMVYAIGVRIEVHFSGVRGYVDPNYIFGKLYKRPIHPGFITQRFPTPKTRIAIKKGRMSQGLQTPKELEEK
ncbi:hypothetical protein KAH81_02715 [bacterium]|nr:hypothetical protein [bacterium]